MEAGTDNLKPVLSLGVSQLLNRILSWLLMPFKSSGSPVRRESTAIFSAGATLRRDRDGVSVGENSKGESSR